jgi:ABC-type sugar transport system ATPase subunit
MIEADHLTIHSGSFVLRNVSFRVPTGGYAVLMGRTGCGKTTLLEALVGLRPVTGGSIRVDGVDLTRMKPSERNLGYVPQDKVLFHTMTVFENLAFAPRVKGWSHRETRAQVVELAGWLGLTALLQRKPRGLSGGESQRVALGRALAGRPAALLLDEPLTGLDERTRGEMYDLLRAVRQRTAVTTIHVTHDVNDARVLADQQLVLSDGGSSTTGAPASILEASRL